MQQPVAQALGLAARELAVEAERLVPREQILGDPDELEPDGVHLIVTKGELLEPAVLADADAVLDASASAVIALDRCDLSAGLVGEDRLEAVPVEVGERQLCAGVRALARTSTRVPAGQLPRSSCSVISQTCPLGRSLPS